MEERERETTYLVPLPGRIRLRNENFSKRRNFNSNSKLMTVPDGTFELLPMPGGGVKF